MIDPIFTEIERLRKALQEIVQAFETTENAEETMYYIAVSALEQKEAA
jgi:hypothetical protein